jgi:Tfp pilus assembly protein PilO
MIDKLLNFKNIKSPREKYLIVALIIAVGLGLYAQIIHRPLSKKINRYKFQIDKYEARVSELKAKFPRIDKQREDIKFLEVESEDFLNEIDEIEKTLPSRENIPQLLGELTRRAKDIKLESIRQKIEEGQEYSRIFVELKFTASYEQIINYIKNIEALSSFLFIEELEILKKEGKIERGGVEARLVVSSLLGEVSFVEQFKTKVLQEKLAVARDIFVSKARPVTEARKIDLKLEGITYDTQNPTAIIDGEVVRVGSQVSDFEVKQILADAVILTDGISEHILSIER